MEITVFQKFSMEHLDWCDIECDEDCPWKVFWIGAEPQAQD